MTEVVETITIKGSDSKPLRINATDFKAGEHELWDDGDADKIETKQPEPQQPAPNTSPVPGAAPPAGAPAPKPAK